MSGSINFTGLSSGIDTNSIISQMLSIDRQPETAIQTAQAALQAQQTAYNTVSAKLLALQATTYPLDALRGFNLVTAASSTASVASVTAQTGAQVGTHAINVTKLAQAQVISTGVQTSQTAPLGQSGQIIINGTAITYQAADSLQTLASNINAAQPGVTASIISPTSGQYYLTLGSTNSGVQGTIGVSDAGAGTLLSGTLGMFTSTPATSSFAHALSPSGHGSALFADSATSIATLEGQTTPSVGNVTLTVGGVPTTVSIDLSKSLSQIASDINTAAPGIAQVVTVTDPITNTSKQQLQLNSTVTGFTDNNNLLANLGIVQQDLKPANLLTPAQDAVFTIDNLPATRATNSFSDAISGVTINLLSAGTTNLTISSDTATITTNINAFVSAYNDALTSISSQATYDSTSGTTGPLFGDGVTSSIFDDLVSNTNGAIQGLPSNLSLLSQIGITIDSNDQLQVDSTALATALSSNLSGVAKLFQASGTSTNPTVQFVSASQSTSPSSTSGYAVYVSTPASQATYVASTAQTSPLATNETLTFGGPLFGTSATASPLTGYTLQLYAGATAADIVSQINANSTLSAQLSASLTVGGELQLTSKQYGSSADFAVVSTANAGVNTSGIGTTSTEVTGVDIAGTINGESATGVGQFLTGSQAAGLYGTNGQALGLQLRVTATTAGNYGSIVYTSGVADLIKNYVSGQTDVASGALTTAVAGLQTQIDDDTSDIADIEAQIADEQTTLQQQFTAMEVAVAQIKAASAGLSALGVSTSSSNSSSTSGSLQ